MHKKKKALEFQHKDEKVEREKSFLGTFTLRD